MSDEDDRTILVTNIPAAITSVQLRDLFSLVGKINELNYLPSLSQCWIEFAKIDGAKASLYLNDTPLGERNIRVVLKSVLNEVTAASTSANGQQHASGGVDEEKAGTNGDATAAATASSTVATSSSATSSSTSSSVSGIAAAAAATLNNPALADLLGTNAPINTNNALSNFLYSSSSSATGFDPNFTSRTIYVGNIGDDCSEALLRVYFAPVGVVVATRFSGGENGGQKYVFVEFATQEAANTALLWDGRMMVDRPIKIGKAQNSITKFVVTTPQPVQQQTILQSPSSAALALRGKVDQTKVQTAMEKVRAAQEAIARKLADPSYVPPTPPVASGPQFFATTITTTHQQQEESKEEKQQPSSSRDNDRPRSPQPSSSSSSRPDYAERMRMKREQRDREDAMRHAHEMYRHHPPPHPFFPHMHPHHPPPPPHMMPPPPPMMFDRWGAQPPIEMPPVHDSQHRHSRSSKSRDRSRDRHSSHRSSRDRDRRSSHSRDRSRSRSHSRDRSSSHRHHKSKSSRSSKSSSSKHSRSRSRSKPRRQSSKERKRQGPPDASVPLIYDGYRWIPPPPPQTNMPPAPTPQ